MLVVGLTGGIGCGKSLVSNLFHQLYKIPVIDADIIAKNLTQSQSIIDEIAEELGTEFVDKNNQLLRDELRQAIFSDSEIRTKLEKILHPHVYEQIKAKIKELKTDYCIVVIPLLLETNRTDFLDHILVVDCTIEEQITRVMQRDHCSKAHVENIISAQIDRETRLALADDVVENSGSIESVKEKISDLHKKFTNLSMTLNQ